MKKLVNILSLVGVIVCLGLFGLEYIKNNILVVAEATEAVEEVERQIEEATETTIAVKAENSIEEVAVDANDEIAVESDEVVDDRIGVGFEEGDVFGTLEIGTGIKVAVNVGMEKETIAKAAAIHPQSKDKHMFVYGHNSNGIFKSLKDVATVGTEVVIKKLDGTSKSFRVRDAHWMSEEDYNEQQTRNDLVLGTGEDDDAALVIVTCCHIESGRGRWVVYCDEA